MIRTMFRFGLAAAAAVLPLLAGARMRGEVTDLKSGEVVEQTTLLDAGRLRMDMRGGSNNVSMILVAEGDNPKLLMVDHQRNEYFEMDKNSMQQMQKSVQGAMSAMQEQLKSMPPEQRAMVEKMMAGRMPQPTRSAPAPKTVYNPKGSATMNGFPCARYEGLRDGQKVSEVCAADPDRLGLHAADFQAFEKLRDLFADLRRSLENSPFGAPMQSNLMEQGLQGFPVHMSTFRGGELVSKFDLKEVKQATASAADFSPGGARKKEFNPGAPR